MSKDQLAQLVDIVIADTENLPPEQWPVDVINDLAFEVVDEGDEVSVSTTSFCETRYILDDGAPRLGVSFEVGQLAVSGMFHGFQHLCYVETDEESGAELEIDELTLRLETLDERVILVPLMSIQRVDVEDDDPVEILGNDDEMLEDIDILIGNHPIDLGAVARLFADMNIEQMTTALYLRYLNQMMRLRDLYSAVLASTVLYLRPESAHRDDDIEIMADFDKGKSFCLIGIIDDNGKASNLLCINAVHKGEAIKLPLTDTVKLLG